MALLTGRAGSVTLEAPAIEQLRSLGVPHHTTSFSSSGLSPWTEGLGLAQTIYFMRHWHPDLVHCASPKGVLYGGLAARISGCPSLVLAVSGMGSLFAGGGGVMSRLKQFAYLLVSRLAFGHCNARVIVQNQDDQSLLVDNQLADVNRIQLISGSGVNLQAYEVDASRPREDLVILPARLLRDKGVVEFVQAARLLRQAGCHWRFALVGAADYDNPSALSQEQVESWAQEGSVEWWGHQKDMAPVFAQARIVCLPSYREGMPKALLEAAAAGCAVITTDTVGCREAIVAGITGDLVPPRDSPALAAALSRLINDPARQLAYGEAGRQLARERFGLDSVIASTLDCYLKLVQSSSYTKASSSRDPSAIAADSALPRKHDMGAQPLIFLQLNEVNFDVVRRYAERHDLPAFKSLLQDFRSFSTFGEEKYIELEPWIQWVSAHTGKTFAEHGVFRLGDVVRSPDSLVQIFEKLESRGLKVGAISPMNARNRLKQPAYFIPDPWTDTPSDSSGFSRRLTEMLRQTVNDNASRRITLKSLLAIAEAALRGLHWRRTPRLLASIAATRKRPWLKALVLDQLLHQVHMYLWRRSRPMVSFVFLNAGAHIQHHYFLNAELEPARAKNPDWYLAPNVDPVGDMLKVYDRILADYLALAGKGTRVIVATGLTQVPYDRVKYYYRLKEHESFLREARIHFTRVLPRMTRDFEVQFDDGSAAQAAAAALAQMTLERTGLKLFGEIEVRERSVFASLTYPDEIKTSDVALRETQRLEGFGDAVAFVAIKNGMHSTRGYAFLSPNTPAHAPATPVHVAALFDLTLEAAG